MANASSAVYSGTAPAFTGQQIVQNLSGPEAQYVKGTATVTGDAASATWTINFIDGTQTLPFIPSGIVCVRSGGAGTQTIVLQQLSTITATSFVTNWSGNLNAATFIVSFIAWK